MSPPPTLVAALAGKYEIERELGRGGMAIVYLATETKHGRQVAVKVLDPDVAAAVGAQRFLNEIRVAATLQHPNLLPLFDSGEADQMLYYVMPYVEGESLRARLDREPQLPVDEALHIATSVASALDHAHRHGVVHRDLKPENILLRDGEPLVADFGVALAMAKGAERLTQTGISLGTPQYMAPEQATGERQIDGRTDVYALGAVLYEMLTGEPPHSGPTAQAVIARILTEPVRPIRATRESIPTQIEDAVTRALARLPSDRWQTAAAFAEALKGPTFERHARPTTRWPIWGLLAVAVAAGIVVGALASPLLRSHSSAPTGTYAFVVTLPDSAAVSTGMGATAGDIAISRDGRSLAYLAGDAAGGDVARGIWMRPLDQTEARPLRGLENGVTPRFSPDGRRLMYRTGNTLFVTDLVGGGSTHVVDDAGSFDWIDDRAIVFSRGSTVWPDSTNGAELWTTTIQNPAPRRVVRPDGSRGILAVSYPAALPGGTSVLATIWKRGADRVQQEIVVASLVDGTISELGLAGTTARYAMGRLIFSREDGSLNTVAYSPRARRIEGAITTLAPSVVVKINGWADFDVADDGTIAYIGGSEARRHLVLVDRAGRAQRLNGDVRRYYTPRFSPDGRMIAVEVGTTTGFDVWAYDRTASTLSAVTTSGRAIRPGGWTPDGQVVFLDVSAGFGRVVIRSRSPDGRLDRQIGPDSARTVEVSRGGDLVAYRSSEGIELVPMNGDRPTRLLVANDRHPGAMQLSRDGRFIVYESRVSSVSEIVVQGTGSTGGALQISSGGGNEPVWSPRGNEVFYRANSRLIAAQLALDPLRVIRRDTLFRDTYLRSTFNANYDVAPDGQHFVMIENEHPDSYPTVLVNKLRGP